MLVYVFQNSVYNALSAVYPHHKFLPWKFVKAPMKFWRSADNQRTYMLWLADQLKIKNMNHWYRVSLHDVLQNYGGGLMLVHRRSIARALATAFPEHEWLPWLFKNVRKEFWMKRENRVKYFNWLAKELNVSNLEDWYKITAEVRCSSLVMFPVLSNLELSE